MHVVGGQVGVPSAKWRSIDTFSKGAYVFSAISVFLSGFQEITRIVDFFEVLSRFGSIFCKISVEAVNIFLCIIGNAPKP